MRGIVIIIDNTDNARDGYSFFGADWELTEEQVQALLDGKCLALSDGEYMHFLSLEREQEV